MMARGPREGQWAEERTGSAAEGVRARSASKGRWGQERRDGWAEGNWDFRVGVGGESGIWRSDSGAERSVSERRRAGESWGGLV